MKTSKMRVMILFCVVSVVLFGSGRAGGDYEISWYTIDGGGGTSRGGEYVLTGTIGQPDAGEGGLAPGKRIGDGLDLMLKPL